MDMCGIDYVEEKLFSGQNHAGFVVIMESSCRELRNAYFRFLNKNMHSFNKSYARQDGVHS